MSKVNKLTQSINSIPENFIQYIRTFPKRVQEYIHAFYYEIFKGPGFSKLKQVMISPIGMLGAFFVIFAIVLGFLPGVTVIVNLLWYVFFYIVIAESFNIIGGYGAEVDFGHVLFVGFGIYSVAILYFYHGVNIWLATFLGGLISAVTALLLGIPMLRLRGAYFAVTMLAVASSMAIIFSYFTDFTGGGAGIFVGKLILQIPNLRLYSYLAIILVAILAFFVTHYVSYTRLGLSLRAIKESPDGAASIGINVLRTKLVAFVISAFLAGLAGGVYMIRILNITPEEAFPVSFTVEMIIITILGGPGSVFGPIIGSIIIIPLRTYLVRWLTGLTVNIFGLELKLQAAYLTLYGLIFILGIIFLPAGIIGWLESKGYIERESLIQAEEETDETDHQFPDIKEASEKTGKQSDEGG